MTMFLRMLSHRLAVLACFAGIGCKSSSQRIAVPDDQLSAKSPEMFINQFEGTELAKCVDENGKPSGHLKAIWRLKNSQNQDITPYIQGFGGQVRSVAGVQIEFQSLIAREDRRVNIPSISNTKDFPRGSYNAFVLRFLTEDSRNGISVLKANGKRLLNDDFASAVLFVPRFALGNEYSTRYFFQMPDGKVHEISCQAVTEDVRNSLNTFSVKDGLHEFTGPRGKRIPLLASLRSKKDAESKPQPNVIAVPVPVLPPVELATPSGKDLRPAKRPPEYDRYFKHERIFECDKDGAIDAIWRIGDEKGMPLQRDVQFITGFSGELQDQNTPRRLSVNAISVDPSPAFYTGKMPPAGRYFFPSVEFSENDFNSNMAYHSELGPIDVGFISGGGTFFIPRDGAGQTVSVALSMGKSLRGNAYQVTSKCKPVRNSVLVWMTHCLGQENRTNAGQPCQP